MATVTLALDAPKKITLSSDTAKLREIIIPAGTRYIEYRSAEVWYYESDTGQSDEGATTVASQQAIDAGTSSFRCPGSGRGGQRTAAARSLFLSGTSASQAVWITATSRAP